MKKKLARGTEDFEKLRAQNSQGEFIRAYVDKSLLLYEAFEADDAEVLLFLRSIRFMKSTNLSMMNCFLNIQYSEKTPQLFDGLKIMQSEHAGFRSQHQNQYPVVFLNLKNCRGSSGETILSSTVQAIQMMYRQHIDLLDVLESYEQQHFQQVLASQLKPRQLHHALQQLTQYLHQATGKKAIVLIDEYDTPLHQAWLCRKKDSRALEDVAEFMNAFLGAGLKGNEFLEKGIMTGVLRTAFASLISNLNNVVPYGATQNKYAQYFGITVSELEDLYDQLALDDAERQRYAGGIERWYNGYEIGGIKLYNPWSVTNFLSSPDQFRPHWMASGNAYAMHAYLDRFFQQVHAPLMKLVAGETVRLRINERTQLSSLEGNDPAVFWGLMLQTGFLTCRNARQQGPEYTLCDAFIPNIEVKGAYTDFVKHLVANQPQHPLSADYQKMLDALVQEDIISFTSYLENYILVCASYFDIPKTPKKRKLQEDNVGCNHKDVNEVDVLKEIIVTPEQVYHVFILGVLAGLHGEYYKIRSNRESGFGRFDLILLPIEEDSPGFIFEFKRSETVAELDSHAQNALDQIEEKAYATELKDYGVRRGVHIGMTFCGKHLRVAHTVAHYSNNVSFKAYDLPYLDEKRMVKKRDVGQSVELATTKRPRLGLPEIKTLMSAELDGQAIQFEIHATRGDGNCGFYALPIANDREEAKKLLLEQCHNANIRALVAPEIRAAILDGSIPSTSQMNAQYAQWLSQWYALHTEQDQLVRTVCDALANSQHAPMNRHIDALITHIRQLDHPHAPQWLTNLEGVCDAILGHEHQLHTLICSEAAYDDFVTCYVGSTGTLSFNRQLSGERATTSLDALAMIKKLNISIWQIDDNTSSNESSMQKLICVYRCGPIDGTPTHLHHRRGLDTHFELMSRVDAPLNVLQSVREGLHREGVSGSVGVSGVFSVSRHGSSPHEVLLGQLPEPD